MTSPPEQPIRGRIRRSTIAVVVVVVLLHLVGWGVLGLVVIPAGVALGGGGGAAVTLGVGLTAYLLGVRHAFDADHIAAIDNTARRLVARGRPATTVGFWFSLGHSTIVVALCVALTLGVSALGAGLADDSSALHAWTGILGPTISSVFLLVIAALNIETLRAGRHDVRGPVLRILGPFEKAVDRPSRMYAVGLLFGLGFDTATEIGLLALAGSASLAAVPWWAALTLPVLFAAGMSAFDTAQGAVMRRAYAWDDARDVRLGRAYIVAVTGLSVLAAVVIAAVQLSSVLVTDLVSAGPLVWIAAVRLDEVGFVLTALMVAAWAGILVVSRRRARRTGLSHS